MGAEKKSKQRKRELWGQLQAACATYDKALFVNTDNVTSKQISILRKEMRKIDALMICGKNTMMKASISAMMKEPEEGDEDYEERKDSFQVLPHLEKILSQLKGNTSIIFAKGDLLEVKAVLDSQVREAPARVGSIAPKDVLIKAGPTGIDPAQTSFFQKLNIATKIVKAKIEIINDFQIITEGDKVTPGQSALLDKLKIRPFEYKMTVKQVMMDGKLFAAECLSITTDDVLAAFSRGVGALTACSLGSGYVVPSAAPHLIMHSFKNLAAVAFATDYSFPQAEALKAAAAAGPAIAAAAPAGEKKAEAKKESEKEESDEGCGNFFGDDDDY